MAGVKISALPTIIVPQLTGIFPVVQGGITSRESLSQLNTLLGANIQLSSTAQVTGLTSLLASFLPLSGGTMTGTLILNTNAPMTALEAASKGYVDTVASGFTVILATQAATTVNLNATQAGAGIGATLTNAGTQAAFAVDGYSALVNDRILVKNQTLTQHNGIYVVTTLGSGATNWVLTRSTDYDTNVQIMPGTLIAVNNGTVNGTTSWLETATVAVVDTDPVLFSQFTFAPTAFFQIINNLSEGVPATMLVNLGLGTPTGTGNVVRQTSPTLITPTLGVASITNLTFPNGQSIFDPNGNAWLTFFNQAAAVNSISIGNANTGVSPTINAFGSDPNVSLFLTGKGTGGVILLGTGTNDSANQGFVGEFQSSVVAFGSALSLTANTARDLTSVLLSAGDWDIWANVSIIGSTNNLISANGWISQTSATLPDASLLMSFAGASLFSTISCPVPSQRITLSTNTTIFVSARAGFSAGTATICGGIYARRRR